MLVIFAILIFNIYIYLVAEPPAAPGGPLVVSQVLRHSMTLAWQPPHYDGGAGITGYIIEMRDILAGGGWTRVDRIKPHIYSYTVSHLTQGHKYMFRVLAENAQGRSTALESHATVEANSPFSEYRNH